LVSFLPVWAKTSRFLVLGLVLLAGCGGSANHSGTTAARTTQAAPEHTAEAAHDRAAEAQRESNEAYAQKQKEDEPEEEKLRKIQEKVEYEDGK
jgi:hypothetical protein